MPHMEEAAQQRVATIRRGLGASYLAVTRLSKHGGGALGLRGIRHVVLPFQVQGDAALLTVLRTYIICAAPHLAACARALQG